MKKNTLFLFLIPFFCNATEEKEFDITKMPGFSFQRTRFDSQGKPLQTTHMDSEGETTTYYESSRENQQVKNFDKDGVQHLPVDQTAVPKGMILLGGAAILTVVLLSSLLWVRLKSAEKRRKQYYEYEA